MQRNIIRIISIIVLLFTFASIFNFSNQDGQTSSGLSRKVMRKIVDTFPITKNQTEENKEKIVEQSQTAIRKTAHFSIYTLVGISIMSFISTYKIKNKNKILISILVGLVYAISDEIHQSFVPGRTASVKDVLIDTLGVSFRSSNYSNNYTFYKKTTKSLDTISTL